VRLQLRRPLAATAVFLAAAGTAALAAPPQAFADARPAAVVSVLSADHPAVSVRPALSVPAANGAVHVAPAAESALASGAVSAGPAQTADAASSPTLGETIKRIKLWQSLASMGILVGALVLVKRLAVRR
jgi:hypothetical protein